MRRKRLAKVIESSSQSGSEKMVIDEPASKVPASNTTPPKSKPAATITPLTDPKVQINSSAPSAVSSAPVSTSSALSPAKRSIDLDSRTLNLNIESSLHVTLRKEGTDPTYLNLHADLGQSSELLSPSNFSEVICSVLMKLAEEGGGRGLTGVLERDPIAYLSTCYKRLYGKESLASESVREGLVKCRGQVVNFMATSLGDPDMFGGTSSNAQGNLMTLYNLLGEDSSTPNVLMVRELVDELDQQGYLGGVLDGLLGILIKRLQAPATSSMPSQPSLLGPTRSRSVLDDLHLEHGV
ncbi:hypothetical protein EON65_22155, partial [archaeon]